MNTESSNIFVSLHSALSRRRVAELFKPPTWRVRKWSWTDYEVASPFAELVVAGESPILVHGPVDDVEAHCEQILDHFRAAGAAFTAECYGPGGDLLREWSEETATSGPVSGF